MNTQIKMILLVLTTVLATNSTLANTATDRMTDGTHNLSMSPVLFTLVSMTLCSTCVGHKELVAAAKEDAALCVASGCDLESMPILKEAVSVLREQEEYASLSDSDLTHAIAVMNQDKE